MRRPARPESLRCNTFDIPNDHGDVSPVYAAAYTPYVPLVRRTVMPVVAVARDYGCDQSRTDQMGSPEKWKGVMRCDAALSDC
jgi:hypothetical protein